MPSYYLFSNLQNLRIKNTNNMIDIFTKSLMFIGENITIVLPSKLTISGIFRGIESDGSLKLEKNNVIEKIYNGTIKL